MFVAQAKTNAMRILEQKKIAYTAMEYDTSDGLLDGVSVAKKVGRDASSVFKTLVARGASKAVYVFVVPVAGELSLKAAAAAVGEKSVEMAAVKDITPLTGYVKGGWSPVGMKKPYPIIIDASAQFLPEIVVSAGRIGAQIALSPKDLAAVVGAGFAQIAQAQQD